MTFMKKITLAIGLLIAHSASANLPVNNTAKLDINAAKPPMITEGGYQLVWADEFEKSGKPDPKNWDYEKGFLRNRETQWYQPDNAFVEDGKLVIEGRKETKPNPNYIPGPWEKWRTSRKDITYTSSSIRTKDLHAWQYGRFEVRAKISAKEGLWPAIWFLGVEGGWPSNGEVDLMEYYDGSILANACWEAKKKGRARWDSAKIPLTAFNDDKWDERFHVWRMDWDENFIKLYVDDQLLNTINLKKTINKGGRGPKNPFHQPHYLLLNLAIGGSNGGDPEKTAFPSRYEVDYVRVYQQK